MTTKTEMGCVNWNYNGREVRSIEDLPQDCIGFVYRIDNLTNGKFYYGRKTIRKIGAKKKLTKKEKELPENKRKTYKYVNTEYKGWLGYNGSCLPLLADISKGDIIKKEIIQTCFSKSEITYFELKAIACASCLEIDQCYNNNILGKVFPPKR